MASLGVLVDPASCDPAYSDCLSFHNLVPVQDRQTIQELLKKGPKTHTVVLDSFFALNDLGLVNFLTFGHVSITVFNLTGGFLLIPFHGDGISNFYAMLKFRFNILKS